MSATNLAPQPSRDAGRGERVDRVDPQRILPPAERDRRAEAARRAHFARMALRRARSKKATAPAIPAEAK